MKYQKKESLKARIIGDLRLVEAGITVHGCAFMYQLRINCNNLFDGLREYATFEAGNSPEFMDECKSKIDALMKSVGDKTMLEKLEIETSYHALFPS